MAPLFVLLISLAATAEPGPNVDPASCSQSQSAQIKRSWPEAKKRLAAAKAAALKAYKGEDPKQRKQILSYTSMLDANADSLPDIARVLGLMDEIVGRSQIVCGAKSDPHCAHRDGYVRRGEGDVIHLCPAVFKDGAEADDHRARNLIHESAHLVDARISQPEGEGYCVVFDCESVCPGKVPYLVADNWSQFAHCASGQKPEEGFVISPSK